MSLFEQQLAISTKGKDEIPSKFFIARGRIKAYGPIISRARYSMPVVEIGTFLHC